MDVGAHEAKTHFSRLFASGRHGRGDHHSQRRARDRQIGARPPGPRREFGRDRGLFTVPEDLDAPLPDEVLLAFCE